MCDRNSNIPEYARNMTWNERQDIDGNGNGYEARYMREHPATPLDMMDDRPAEGSSCVLAVAFAVVMLGVMIGDGALDGQQVGGWYVR